MQQLTVVVEEHVVDAYKRLASEQGMSLDETIRKVLGEGLAQQDWLEECFGLMDLAAGDSNGRQWRREDLYDV